MKVLNFLFLSILFLFVSQNKTQAASVAYVANLGRSGAPDGTVSVIDLNTQEVIKTITVKAGSDSVAITPFH